MGIHALLVLAADGAEPSKTAFYVGGGLLAVWAVIVASLGLSRPDFPGTAGAASAVYAISTVLMLGAGATALLTS
jgi:hypothetical protein